MTQEIQIYQLQDMIRQIAKLNEKCESNMKNLHAMMLELKGIVAMVRPQVKKTGWYGEEIKGNASEVKQDDNHYIELNPNS